jgi:hypothetical protein
MLYISIVIVILIRYPQNIVLSIVITSPSPSPSLKNIYKLLSNVQLSNIEYPDYSQYSYYIL